MKRLLLAVLMVIALTVPAYAIVPVYDKSNVEVGVEYNYSHQDIESNYPIGISVGSWLNGELTNKTTNVKEWSFLATLGYKISPQLTPYMILGNGYINLDQELSGSLGIGDWSGSIPILTTQLRGASGFQWGGGAKGELLEFNNGITIGYDTRWTTLTADSNDKDAIFFGDSWMSAGNDMEATLSVFNLDLAVSKYFDLTKKCEDGTICKKYWVEGITPFVGGRYTHSDLNVKNDITIGEGRRSIGISTESNSVGNMISAIGGVAIKINKSLVASVGGIVGQENGVNVKCIYNF